MPKKTIRFESCLLKAVPALSVSEPLDVAQNGRFGDFKSFHQKRHIRVHAFRNQSVNLKSAPHLRLRLSLFLFALFGLFTLFVTLFHIIPRLSVFR